MSRVIINSKLDTSGGYRIKWHEDQYYIVGHGTAIGIGPNYTSAKFVLSGMLDQPPVWNPEPDMLDPGLNAFGRDLADV